MSETLIKVEGVSKKFCRSLKKSLWYGMQDLGREITGHQHGGNGELRPDEFWAVKEVSFELKRGECLGLIGRNGAGKTTLLKMLNGLIKPDSGRIEMKGRIGALIALGAGFNPILTGRENIYTNASILGLSKREIDQRIEEIIEFAEISDFIDTPVQNYSSGMQVRLGFSVASTLKPDILLLDEVMAVGDMDFVLKCFNKMDRLINDTAVIFVSHSMPQLSRVATDVLLMEKGTVKVKNKGVAAGIDAYYAMTKPIPSFSIGNDATLESIAINNQFYSDKAIIINRLDDMSIFCRFNVTKTSEELTLYLAFYDAEQRNIAEFVEDSPTLLFNSSGKLSVEITIPSVSFSKGIYSVTVALRDIKNKNILLRTQSAAFFQVISKKAVWSAFQLDGKLRQIN